MAFTVDSIDLGISEFMDLYSRAFPDGNLSRYAIRQYMDLFPNLFLLCRNDQVPVGYHIGAVSAEDPTTGWGLSLGVVPAMRRKGVGKLLFQELIKRLQEMGVVRMKLTVSESNQGTQTLFATFGCQVSDHPTDYYGDGVMKFVGIIDL